MEKGFWEIILNSIECHRCSDAMVGYRNKKTGKIKFICEDCRFSLKEI